MPTEEGVEVQRGEVPWRWVFGVALVPAVLAVAVLGRIHPDEVYQFLEPAYFRAHGYGILAWEWREGIRNWAVPLFFSWLLQLCAKLGIDNPWHYRAVLEVPQYLLHAFMLAAVFRYAERRGGKGAGLGAVVLVGLWGSVLLFAGRTLGESLSAALLVMAVEALDREERPVAAGLWGGLFLGLAVVVRYGSAVVVVAALGWLFLRRRWKTVAFACLAGLAVALGLGALDWVTWHRPFHSLLAYFDFNVRSGRAALTFGSSPAYFYLQWIGLWLPLWAWVGLVFSWRYEKPRLPLPLVAAVLYVLAVSFTAHKEERFLYPALVLVAVSSAAGLHRAVGRLREGRARTGAWALALALGLLVLAAKQPELRGDQFRAIVRATRDERASGLLIIADGIWGAGGNFYIGKNIPWTVCDFPTDLAFLGAMGDPRFNRVVSRWERAFPELAQAGFRQLERIGDATVWAR